jgi:CHAD domain-containing protein
MGDILAKSRLSGGGVRSPLITPRSYTETLSRSEKTVSDKINAYLKEPSEENVHDLRTSIRRVLTIANILPKKIRVQKESRKYLEDHEKLLRLNAKVRDIDIILSKLPRHGDDPAYSNLAKQLNEIRESSLKKAQRFAASLKDGKSFPVEADKLTASLIQKRFKKTASALTKTLKRHLRIVVKEPKNLDELHKLREDSRRLRFTLEIDDNAETSKLLPVLETWQDVLGKIRDSDVFISRFEDEKRASKIEEVLEQEKSGRQENYEKFLEIFRESPSPLKSS